MIQKDPKTPIVDSLCGEWSITKAIQTKGFINEGKI